MNDTYCIYYQLLVDGKDSGIELIGSSKKDAYEGLDNEWRLCHRGTDPPARRRCKLEYIQRIRNG